MFLNQRCVYFLQLQFQINTQVSWRGTQLPAICFGNALPFPPSTIPLASLETDVIAFTESNISVLVTWPPPEKPYGMITNYEIVLTPIPLAEQADPITDSAPGTILVQTEVSGNERNSLYMN